MQLRSRHLHDIHMCNKHTSKPKPHAGVHDALRKRYLRTLYFGISADGAGEKLIEARTRVCVCARGGKQQYRMRGRATCSRHTCAHPKHPNKNGSAGVRVFVHVRR